MSEIKTTTMKAVVVRQVGPATSPQALHFESDYPIPQLQKGYALVKNDYSGVNFIDTYHRKGLYPRDVPFICGQEGAGTIVSLMPGAEEDLNEDEQSAPLKVGQRVVYSHVETYAEYTLVPLDKLVVVPPGMDIKIALACMVQGLTAHYLVTSAHTNLIKSGEWCLIYSVGSGTCQWAAQMAKLRGYKVIGTTSKKKLCQANHAKCDELIVLDEDGDKGYADYGSVDIAQRVMDITNGKGVKLVIDGVGKATSDISLKCVAQRGIFVSFGNASGTVEPFSLLRLTNKSAFVTRPKLLDYISTRGELLQRINDVFEWVQSGKVEICIHEEFALEEASVAHQFIEAGKTKGKLLLRMH